MSLAEAFGMPGFVPPRPRNFTPRTGKQLDNWRKAEGFTQRDYAVRNASWHVTDIFAELHEADDRREGFLDAFSLYREGPAEKVPVPDTAVMSQEIKHVARTFGADLVGITHLDTRWVYSHSFSAQTGGEKPNDWPLDLPNVIVTAQAMDYDLIRTVPSALSGTATGLGYGHDALVLLSRWRNIFATWATVPLPA